MYQEPEIYARLFDEVEKGPFQVSPGRTKKDEKIKSILGAPKLYIFTGGK